MDVSSFTDGEFPILFPACDRYGRWLWKSCLLRYSRWSSPICSSRKTNRKEITHANRKCTIFDFLSRRVNCLECMSVCFGTSSKHRTLDKRILVIPFKSTVKTVHNYVCIHWSFMVEDPISVKINSFAPVRDCSVILFRDFCLRYCTKLYFFETKSAKEEKEYCFVSFYIILVLLKFSTTFLEVNHFWNEV